ncbi:hypothetical protein, partial [Enterococcus faecium]|uniref:hypothetical protein n=1 Tax=Enterococcus faecium TaxID=1352 RepID=UPI001C9C9898
MRGAAVRVDDVREVVEAVGGERVHLEGHAASIVGGGGGVHGEAQLRRRPVGPPSSRLDVKL